MLCVLLVFTLSVSFEMRSVMAKDTMSTTTSVKEETKQNPEKKTKEQERAEELSKMPLSGQSPIVYIGIVAISTIALGLLISVGKSTNKKDKFV